MSSSQDIVSLTTSAVEALEAINSQAFEGPKIFSNDDASNQEPCPVESVKEIQFVGDSGIESGKIPREISPKVPESEVEIVDIQGPTTRYKDRTLECRETSTSSIVVHPQDETVLRKDQEERKSKVQSDNVRITRFSGNTRESRQKLASRKKFADASAFQGQSAVYPKVVQAQVVPHRSQSNGVKTSCRSSTEKAILDQYEKETHHDHAAILSAATSAAAAAAVGTQPVLQKIESRICELATKVDSLEAGQASLIDDRMDRQSMESGGRNERLCGAAGDVEERLMRELAVERELAKERERQRRRDEQRRERENEKFQRRLLALTALQNRARLVQHEIRASPSPDVDRRGSRGGRPPLLEQILHRDAEPLEGHERGVDRAEDSAAGSAPMRTRDDRELSDTRRKLHDFEGRFDSELTSIRMEFEDLRRRADAITVSEPPGLALMRPSLPLLPDAPPRTEALELAERQLERIGHMQENLEQNIASIERAREAEFFYSVLNDLSGDQNAINGAVTRIMVDDALKRASREAKRQVEKEWRSGRRVVSPVAESVGKVERQPGRRGPQAKVDSGLRRRKPSPSPPRDGAVSPKRFSLFDSVNSLVDFSVLRPGQLGNRRQRGDRAPYLHFANEVRERRRSPVAVSHQSPQREASDSPTRRPREEGKGKGARSHVPAAKINQQRSSPSRGRPVNKKKPRCQLLSVRQYGRSPGLRRLSPETEEPPKCVTPPKSEMTEILVNEDGNITVQQPDDLESLASEATTRRSEDGEGLELPGWRKTEKKKARGATQMKRGAGVDRRPPVPPPAAAARSGRDPVEVRIRNRLEDEVIAEVVNRMGHHRELAVQTASPTPSSDAGEAPGRADTARLRNAVQEVVLSEAMRLLRRSLPQPPPRVVQHTDLVRVPTPIPSPEGPSLAEESVPRRSPVPVEREEYSDEFEDEEEVSEFEELPQSRGKPLSPSPPPFSPRQDVVTPTRSSVESLGREERDQAFARVVMPVTPELSPRDEEEETVPVPTPRWRAPATTPPPLQMADFAVQTVDDTGVQTVAVTEVQTDLRTPEPPPVEPSEQLSISSGESSSETYPPTDSMLSDGQWMLDRSEGQHHDICVDWALRHQLANAAMTSRRRPETTDSSTDLTAEVRTLTEEGEAVWTRRYEPQRDLLMQLLLEQQRHARSGVVLPEMQGILDSAGATLISGDLDTLSMGQVPRPVPRYRRRRGSGGEMSGATSSGINDEGLEDTPVRDSAGSLPPGVIRVRESMGSEDAQHDLQDTQGSHMGVSASEGETRVSDKLDIDLARYLGMSMNTTTGTGASDDFTKTGMLSTTQLIQDALQTTELSATGEPSSAYPLPRHRVNITVPTLAEVPSDSPSPDEDVSEILMP